LFLKSKILKTAAVLWTAPFGSVWGYAPAVQGTATPFRAINHRAYQGLWVVCKMKLQQHCNTAVYEAATISMIFKGGNACGGSPLNKNL